MRSKTYYCYQIRACRNTIRNIIQSMLFIILICYILDTYDKLKNKIRYFPVVRCVFVGIQKCVDKVLRKLNFSIKCRYATKTSKILIHIFGLCYWTKFDFVLPLLTCRLYKVGVILKKKLRNFTYLLLLSYVPLENTIFQ